MTKLNNNSEQRNWKMIVFLSLVICQLSVSPVWAQIKLNFNENSPLRKLQIAEMAVSHLYVDSVDEAKLVEDGIKGMLKELDPHSSYTDAKETKAMNEPLAGDFEGIGVQFNMVEDTLLVVQTITGGPSEKVGIIAGDRIIAVNDTAIAGVKMSRTDIMKRLRGKKGTKVTVKVVRRGVEKPLEFVIKRDKIPVHSINAAYMIRPQAGYIRIESFGSKTYDEFMAAVDSLRQHGMKHLIIDLQENGGGYLETAVRIINEFLDDGDMIVYTSGRAVPRREYRAHGNGSLKDIGITVLIDEFSASASEIVAGAIQDHDRGLLVGRRSFGKGLVQRPIELPDGSMIRLTVAHYYIPSGRCIQKPYKKGDLKEYQMDIEYRLKKGELTNPDSIHFADSLKCFTLKQHRAVYGGGGVMPDIFVPLDTMKYTKCHRQLVAKSIIINQTLKYIDNNRKQLHKTYKTFNDFERGFTVPQSLLDNIFAEGEKQNIKPKEDNERTRTCDYLSVQLKSLIARDLWGMCEYFKIWNEHSDIVKKALQVMTDN